MHMSNEYLGRLAVSFYWLPLAFVVIAFLGSLIMLLKFRKKTTWRNIVGLVGLCAVGVLVAIVGSLVVNAEFAARKANSLKHSRSSFPH